MADTVHTAPTLPAQIEYDARNDKLVARIEECLTHPLADTFRESLGRLAAMAKAVGGRVRLGLDFAPLSFGFAVIRADGEAWICGGLIFHGSHDRSGDGGGPTFSVNVTPIQGWTLHT